MVSYFLLITSLKPNGISLPIGIFQPLLYLIFIALSRAWIRFLIDIQPHIFTERLLIDAVKYWRRTPVRYSYLITVNLAYMQFISS